ncbi:MAG: HAMP domain-containing histidine kinase, partial [Saprospiraceae bacterium]|nr:HAMP domain-containing histidine kinase [Saprospiraceae bacterium]
RSQEEYTQKIRYSLEEIEKMTNTLEQLLLIARLESKSSKNKDALISIASTIDESVSRYREQITSKNLEINIETTRSEELLVPQYYSKIIIDNLLSNAIKYSHRNSKIRFTAGTKDGRISCSIEDEGIGMKEDDLSRVYDNFFRSDTFNHKNISGNGLGLSIVKKCVEAIGGDIKIVSSLGLGTSVTIIF